MTTTQTRRLAAMALAAVSFLTCLAGARGQTYELKLSHFVPPSHTVHKVLEAWAADVDTRSGGRLKIRIYPASQLGPVQRQFDLARNGQVDIAYGLTGATPGRYPMTELACLPFVWPSAGSTSEVTSRRLTELAPKYLAGEFQGLRILWIGVTPTNGLFTGRREIDSPTDVKGMKIRFQGEMNAKLLRELGAVPLQVPPGEIADGMGKGVIDGALFDYEAAESFGLGAVTRHVTEPGFVTATVALVMNNATYDALPADLKAIIDETSGPAAAQNLGAQWDAAERHGRAAMLAQGVAIQTFEPAEVERMKERLAPLVAASIANLAKAGRPAQEMLDAYRR